MADRILVSVEEMQAAVSAYTTQKDAKLEAINVMKGAVDAMDGSWDGPASEVFLATFQAAYDKLMKIETRMEDAIKELNGLIEAANEAQETIEGVGKGAQAAVDAVQAPV